MGSSVFGGSRSNFARRGPRPRISDCWRLFDEEAISTGTNVGGSATSVTSSRAVAAHPRCAQGRTRPLNSLCVYAPACGATPPRYRRIRASSWSSEMRGARYSTDGVVYRVRIKGETCDRSPCYPCAVPRRGSSPRPVREVEAIVGWYLQHAYGVIEGPAQIPYFADSARVGPFAVDLTALRSRDDAALFQLLILMGLYQSRRDVDIMAVQRTMPAGAAKALTSPSRLRVLVGASRCEQLRTAADFDVRCDVHRDFDRGTATCRHRPRTPCHVKEATLAIRRMGDMGMLPTSAWLHLRHGGLRRWFDEACAATLSPTERARVLVERVATIHRIGPKLAAMYVSALSTPELTPGFAPWRPEVDGSRLVVVDANVARVIDHVRRGRGPRTYSRLASWLIAVADRIDLRRLRRDLPARSPRLVQQALYIFGSRSNRAAQQDRCVRDPCTACPSAACPFVARRAG